MSAVLKFNQTCPCSWCGNTIKNLSIAQCYNSFAWVVF
uniref:Uncharacterized protein n=1 Tax=Rhizophora mucronata TaxID=61149 RepID=A0A2P2R108_RHIMU